MKFKLHFHLGASLLAWLAAAGSAQANVLVFSDEASFDAATTAQGTETFFGIDQGTLDRSPMARRTQIGETYHYQIADGSGLVGAGSDADTWLTTNDATDVMTFSHFAQSVSAFGGYFFGSDFNGQYQVGTVTLSVTDAAGETFVQTLVDPTTSSFFGITSYGAAIVSVDLYASPLPDGDSLWPTVRDVTLGQAMAPVPEPATLPLLMAGGALTWLVSRRRRTAIAG